MKKNAVIPYAIIAVLGIVTVILISFLRASQRDDIQQAEEGGEEATEETEENATSDDPEEIFESNCASCHGGDLSGGAGPDLTSVGSDHSEEEIEDIIINGQGSMPPGLVPDEEAAILAGWLAEKQ